MPFTSFSGHYRWQEGAAVRFAPEESCPVLAFARSLDQLDQRAQGQAPPLSSRFLTGEPNAEVGRVPAKAKAAILTTAAVARCYDDCGQVRGFLQRGQTGAVLERVVWRHEEGERSTKRIRRTLGEIR